MNPFRRAFHAVKAAVMVPRRICLATTNHRVWWTLGRCLCGRHIVVRTIATWIPATNRTLSDAGEVSTLLDSFLRHELDGDLEEYAGEPRYRGRKP